GCCALPVQAARRRTTGCDPVDGNVVQQLVAGENGIGVTVAVGPRPELLHDPRQLAGRRVHQAVAERLRPARLLVLVARAPPLMPLEVFQALSLEIGGVVVDGAERRQRHVYVDADDTVAVRLAQIVGDGGAPVAALGAIASVLETGHERRPGVADPGDAPMAAGGGRAESEAGQRWAHPAEAVG